MTRVLLWGAGQDCEDNMMLLPNDWLKLAIVDSDESKYGAEICGVSVIGPKDVQKYEFDYIIIASSKYFLEIKGDIKRLGIPLFKIIDGRRCNKNATKQEHVAYYQNLIKNREIQFATGYRFESRARNTSKLFYVLAGYKEALWKDVFERMKKFIPKDIDVCILSSGLYNVHLSEICEENNWSYLSTEVNDVAMIQNIVISLFPQAEYIYKMDEDVFITKGSCEKMLKAYIDAARNAFDVGIVGPMIPLHTNGYLFLRRFGLEKKYEEEIGEKHVWGGRWTNSGYASNPRIAKFCWAQGNLDDLNRSVENDLESYVVTPIKYAICFILFKRSVYEEMGGFNVVRETHSTGINGDEGQLLEFCMHHCMCTVVATNTICGHFSYPLQEEEMIAFRNRNYSFFEIRE